VLIAAVALLVLAALLTVLVEAEWSPLVELDTEVARSAYDFTTDNGLVDLLEVVAVASSGWSVRIVLLLVAIYAVLRGRTRVGAWIGLSAAVTAAAAPLAKVVFGRPRPAWPEPLAVEDDFAFPSGHATGAGFAVAVAVLLTRMSVVSRTRRRLLYGCWLLLGLLIGLDRVLLGVHYASDVVAGWSLGAGLTLLLAVAITPWPPPETGPASSTTRQRPSRLAVVLNPTKVTDVATLRSLIQNAAKRHGWRPPTFYETTSDDPGIAMTEAALEAGTDMVIVAGGDGTVRVVCSELARTGVPVGIVPLGTGNLLARNLTLPLRVTDAIEVALSGQDRAIDVVEVRGDSLPETCFTVMGGIGFDAAIMAGASEALKQRMGWRAYVVSAMRNLRYPARRVEVSVDGDPFMRYRARTVVVGNVGLLQAGIPLLPDARFDDGRLDVVVVAPQRWWGWLTVAVRVLRRGRTTDARLARMTGTSVVVRSAQPLARQLDGDSVGEGRELRCQVLAGTLLVRVPR